MNGSDKLTPVLFPKVRCRVPFLFWLFVGWWLVGAGQLAAQPASELDLARELHLRGERAEALRHYRAFLALPGTSATDRATALNNTCVLLQDLGEMTSALDACNEALELRRGLGDERRLSRTLNNLGLVQQSMGRYTEAREAYLEALAANRASDDVAAAAVNLANLGLLASDEGLYGRALERHLEVETLADEHAGESWAEEQKLVAWINRGVVYEKLGAYDQALALYQRLLEEEAALGTRRWATVLLNLGTVYRNLGDPHQGVDAYRRAALIFEREGDRAALASARLNVGQVLQANLRRPREAEVALHDALRLARETGDRGVEIQALFLLGEVQLDLGNPAEAETSFESCLKLSIDSGSAEGEWSARYGLGRLAGRAGVLDEALEQLMAAVGVLERTRARVGDRDLRSGFFAGWRHVYEYAVDLLWQQYELEPQGPTPGAVQAVSAFGLVQRAKQRELVEAMGGSVDPAQNPLDLGKYRSALGDATLVEYFFTAESLFAWRLDGAALRWWRVESGGVARSAMAVHAALASGRAPPPGDIERLAQLPPIASLDSESPVPVVIAPDGALRYLPFEILPGPGGELLVERRQISYLPAASALLRPESTPKSLPRRQGFVGLADPAPSASAAHFASRFVLGPLPSGRREIRAAADQLPGDHVLLVDDQATVAALRGAMAGGSRVLHLAAHTVFDDRPGGGAAVLLAPGEEGDDGLLGPADLAGLALDTDLTVLAACRTAVGPLSGTRGGSAFGSLTGSFLAAGSGAVLATLWDVGDEATEVFMQQLYYELGRGVEPSRALTLVKRRMSQDPRWQAPHLWSAYVLVGESPPVVGSWHLFRRRHATQVGIGLLLLVALLGLVLRRPRPT